jgi:hypothetical protein
MSTQILREKQCQCIDSTVVWEFFQIWELWKFTIPSLVNSASSVYRMLAIHSCVYDAFCVTPLAKHNPYKMVRRGEGLHLQGKKKNIYIYNIYIYNKPPWSLNTKFNVSEVNTSTSNSHQLVQRPHSLQAPFQLHDQRMIADHIAQPVLLPLQVVQLLLGQALMHLPLLVPQHSAITVRSFILDVIFLEIHLWQRWAIIPQNKLYSQEL